MKASRQVVASRSFRTRSSGWSIAGFVIAGLLAVAVLIGLGACSSTALDTSESADSPGIADSTNVVAPVTNSPSTAPAQAARFSDLPTVTLDELPDEAIGTLRLIRDGGPYPYRQDGSTFQNREGILPDEARGHYQEFTVDTPGLSHRGARRFVQGEDGALYYTDDHYDSFRELVSS